MKKDKNYNIGLDIGVASVGWCVTDEESNILKKGSKNMWGSRIFNEAQTAVNRRTFRGNRRRLERRKQRINILQSLVNEDMENEYPNFFPMLKESYKTKDDKTISTSINGSKHNLFSELGMTDISYYKKYKTIYHLRNHLVNTTEKVDFRLVYLAIHHIIKYRGNFLYDGDFNDNTFQVEEFLENIIQYLKNAFEIELKSNKSTILEILKQNNISKTKKKEQIISCFGFEKQDKQVMLNFASALIGSKFELNKIFNTVELTVKEKISFAEEIENEDVILAELQENSEIYECMKTIYSWYILKDMLPESKTDSEKVYISNAFIDKYNKYAKDLKLLKNIYKKYFSEEYNDMFRINGTNNYVAYNGKKCSKCKPEDFFTMLKNKIKQLPESCIEKNNMLNDIEDGNFLKKINTTDNGAIPHQLHQKELEKILENQSKYYKTLAENKENIIKLFEFKIPYYVGPLSKNNKKWSWVIRNNDEPIRPWDFEENINTDATAEEFIKRMTNKCTYLLNEDVMPKQSLLYSKYCVLNELNNIRIDNRHLGRDEKAKIIENLFKKYKKVTIKLLKDYLKKDGFETKIITGLSDGENFNSSMASYIDMEKIFGLIDEDNSDKYEKLIYWITIFEDKKILKRKIKNSYPEISNEQLNKLIKLKYTGWSRLSKKLIAGLKSYDGDTIMEKLEKTSMNFMQIINEEKFGFDKQINNLVQIPSSKITYMDIDEIQTSPANKRAIWQAICVVKEITKIMKKEPKNIYIEFARNEEEKAIKDNRAKQLLKKYETIEKQLKELKDYQPQVYKELKRHQNDKTLSEKMYLYYIQNGKSLYSGKQLNLNDLSRYEVDHILPQSYIKDDSIDNKALVLREENQWKKDNLLLEDRVIDNMSEWWKSLLNNGLISQSKYFKLTRRKMLETDTEKEKFIQRQLVETRQITKNVTNLLTNMYPNTEIFALRAELTHGFRQKYKIYKNRNVNNYHHAHDAYILCTIGNIIDKEWHSKEQFQYSKYVKKYLQEIKNKNVRENYGMIMYFINKYVNIAQVKKVMNFNDCFISRMLQEETGEFYNQTLYSPKDMPVITLKNDRPTEKYGGYSGENKAFFVIFGYICNGKQEYQLTGIPIQIAYKIKNGKENLENYIRTKYLSNKDYLNFRIIRDKVLKNQEYLDENNELMRFCSDSEIRPAKELIIDKTMTELIHLINADENKLSDEEKEKIDYEYMFDYICKKIHLEYKCLGNSLIKILNSKEKFLSLTDKEKKMVINKLIDMISNRYVNLKEIGLGSAEGRKSNQSFKTERLLKMTFIDKSVTGMYERRFKINGVENCCCK